MSTKLKFAYCEEGRRSSNFRSEIFEEENRRWSWRMSGDKNNNLKKATARLDDTAKGHSQLRALNADYRWRFATCKRAQLNDARQNWICKLTQLPNVAEAIIGRWTQTNEQPKGWREKPQAKYIMAWWQKSADETNAPGAHDTNRSQSVRPV